MRAPKAGIAVGAQDSLQRGELSLPRRSQGTLERTDSPAADDPQGGTDEPRTQPPAPIRGHRHATIAELLDVAFGVAVIAYAYLTNRSVHRAVERPEHDIPKCQVVAEVAVAHAWVDRMMPAVQLRRAEDVVQRAESKSRVRVLEESDSGVDDEVQADNFRCDTEQQEGQRVEHELKRFLERMKTADAQPEELARRVMYRVQAPQPRQRMRRTVKPVA